MPGAAERSRARRTAFAAIPLIAGWLLASDAPADLFRCQRPDGSVLYTDSEASCPGAKPHRPLGAVQNFPSSHAGRTTTAPAPASVRRRDALRQERHESALKAEWVAVQRKAQRDLEIAEARREGLLPFVTICNRGGALYIEKENGLRDDISCNEIKAKVAELDLERKSLHAYLNGELQAECRKAGCLPGWLRTRGSR